jgi:putative inorganic carbon (HCO3(-)) transporter
VVTRRTLMTVLILLGTTGLALLFSLVLLKSEMMAIVTFILGLGVTVVFLEPFVGLLNYLFFLYVRPQEFIPGFVGVPVMLLLGSATFAFTLLHMGIKRRSLGLSAAPQNFLMFWFLVAIAVSNLAHANIGATTFSVREFMPIFLLFYMITINITTERKLFVTLYLILLMTVFLAGQGIYQYYTGVGIAGQELFQGRIVSIGIFADPNDLALALLIMLPFAFMEFTASASMVRRIVSLLFAVAIGTTVFMSESRGGILSFGVLVMIMFWRRFGWKVGLAVGFVAFVAIFVVGPSRMGTISTDEDSAYERIVSWTVAIELFVSNPVFGVGAHQFTEFHYKTAHNSFLLCASELGLFGYVPFVLMIYVSIKNLYFVTKNGVGKQYGNLARYADSIMLGLIAFLCAAVFLSRTYIELIYILFGLSAVTTTLYVQRDGGRYKLISRNDLIMSVVVAIGSIVFFKFFLLWAW